MRECASVLRTFFVFVSNLALKHFLTLKKKKTLMIHFSHDHYMSPGSKTTPGMYFFVFIFPLVPVSHENQSTVHCTHIYLSSTHVHHHAYNVVVFTRQRCLFQGENGEKQDINKSLVFPYQSLLFSLSLSEIEILYFLSLLSHFQLFH